MREFHSMKVSMFDRRIFLFLVLFLNQINLLFGLTLIHYQVEIVGTNTFNVSSFDECLCKCLTSFNCSFFGYWFSTSLPKCQLYNSSEEKPDILNYILQNNDTESGLYRFSNVQCQSSILNSSYNYNNNKSAYNSLSGNRIISVIVMTITNSSRLLAIDGNNASYYIFDRTTFQMIDNGTFSPSNGIPLCAQNFLNSLYIGYTTNLIEIRQFILNGNTSRQEAQLLNSFSTSGGGPPQSLAVSNINIIYYVVGPNILYVLLTQSNTSIHLQTFSGVVFVSPSVSLVFDSIDMELFLATNNGKLFRVELSSMNINNGTSLISPGSFDQYQMALSSSAGFRSQIILFIQQNYSNKSFSTMQTIDLTNSLPIFPYSPYNFQFDDNYSLFTANAQQGVNAFFRL